MEPTRCRRARYLLTLPASVQQAAAALAEANGVSLNQFIAAAVAEKFETLRNAWEFLEDRAANTAPHQPRMYLRSVADRPPVADGKLA